MEYIVMGAIAIVLIVVTTRAWIFYELKAERKEIMLKGLETMKRKKEGEEKWEKDHARIFSHLKDDY